MKRPKILFLCKRYYTNKDLMEDRYGRMYQLPKELANRGYQVTVVALDYNNQSEAEFKIPNAHFISIPSKTGGLNLFSGKHRTTIENISPDIIVGSANSNIGMIAYILSKKLQAIFVFDAYDYYPAFPSKFKLLNQFLFNFCTKYSDLNSVVSETLRQKIRSNKTIILENGVNLDVFKFADKCEARKELNIAPETKVVGYFGSIESRSGLDLLIEATLIAQETYPSIVLLVAGQSDGSIPLDNPMINYRGPVPHTKVAQYISASDVVVIPYPLQAQNNYTNSCKIAEYLACQVPIVATDISDYKRHFSNPENVFCTPGDVNELAAKIIAQLNHPHVNTFPMELSWQSLGEKFEASLHPFI